MVWIDDPGIEAIDKKLSQPPAPQMPRGWIDDPAPSITPGAAPAPAMPRGWIDDPAPSITPAPYYSEPEPIYQPGWVDNPVPNVLYEDYQDTLPYFGGTAPSATFPTMPRGWVQDPAPILPPIYGDEPDLTAQPRGWIADPAPQILDPYYSDPYVAFREQEADPLPPRYFDWSFAGSPGVDDLPMANPRPTIIDMRPRPTPQPAPIPDWFREQEADPVTIPTEFGLNTRWTNADLGIAPEPGSYLGRLGEIGVDTSGGGGFGSDLWDQTKRLGGAIDRYALQPLDYVSEVGTDLTPALLSSPTPSPLTLGYGLAQLADSLTGNERVAGPDTTLRELPEALDYRGTVEEFRDRPMWQQIVAGTLYDPTTPIGLSKADDVIDLAGAGVRYADDVMAGRRLGALADETGAIRANPFSRGVSAPTPVSTVDDAVELGAREYQLADLGTSAAEEAVATKATTRKQPGAIGSLIDRSPLGDAARKVGGVVNPSLGMEEAPLVAFQARAAVDADLGTRFASTRAPILQRINEAFSPAPRYVGPEPNPIKGTFLDIAQNPQDYVLTGSQKAVLNEIDDRNTELVNLVRSQYGSDIELYTPKNPGAIWMPNVNTSEDVIKRINTTEQQMVARGLKGERVYDTARERAIRDPKFKPETNPEILIATHDNALAQAAANNTFKVGAGGKTRVEVIDATHPGLREQKEALQAKLQSAKGRLETAIRQQGQTIRDFKLSGRQERRIEARMEGLRGIIDGLGNEYGPQLSHLSGQVYELRRLAEQLRAAQRGTPKRPGLGSKVMAANTKVDALLGEVERLQNETRRVVQAYRTANVQPDFVLNKSTFQYHSPEESANIDELLRVSNGAFDKPLALADISRATVLGSDFSPLTIQGQLNVFRAPIQSVKAILKMVAEGGPSLDAVARNEPDMVRLYTQAKMRPLGKVDLEFSPKMSLPARIPIIGGKLVAGEDKAFEVTQRIDYETWKKTFGMLKKFNPGMTDEVAANEAANALSKTVPSLSGADRGVSASRGAVERAAITSTSFLSSPALIVKDATSGLAKLIALTPVKGPKAAFQSLRGREQVALIHAFNMSTSLVALSTATAALQYEQQGRNPIDGIKAALTPGSRHFLAIHIPGTNRTVPIGGPVRSFVQGVSPRYYNGEWQAPDLLRFAKSKVAPAAGTAVDLIQNKDWLGDPIRKGDGFEQVLRAIEYAVEGTLMPITAGGIAEGIRKGDDFGQILEDTAAQAFGGNVSRPSANEQRDTQAIKEYGKPYWDLEPAQRKEFDEKHGKVLSSNPVTRERQERVSTLNTEWAKFQEADNERFRAGDLTGEEWRKLRAERQFALRQRKDEIYASLTDEKARTALDRYFATIEQFTTDPTVIDGTDWDKVAEWLAKQSDEDRAYIERNTGLGGTDLEREYRADVDKIAKSGYFDLEKGKKEFREEHPDIAKLIRKWGYSATSIRAEDVTAEFAKQQAADDRALQAGTMPADTWRDNYRSRQDELRGHKDEIYAGLAEDGVPTTNMDKYFAAIDAAVMENGKVNWDEVDRWLAQQPASVQAEIDNYTGTALTPQVAEYRADVKRIEQSGYWDIRDQFFDKWLELSGATGEWTEDEYWGAVQAQLATQAAEWLDANRPGWRGVDPNLNVDMAETQVASIQAKFQNPVTDAQQEFRQQHPDITQILAKWNYGGGGKKEVNARAGIE